MNEKRKRKQKEMAPGTVKERKGMGDFKRNIIALVIGTLIGIIVTMAALKSIIVIAVVMGADMEGTFSSGDRVLGTRFDVGEEDIQRYDILIFTLPDDPEKLYLKRMIGLPGDVVEVREGSVYVNGVEIDDSFVKSPMNRSGDGVYVVPEGCYFFLGDNRNNSNDSRFWDEKYVPIENIQARARVALSSFFDMCWL